MQGLLGSGLLGRGPKPYTQFLRTPLSFGEIDNIVCGVQSGGGTAHDMMHYYLCLFDFKIIHEGITAPRFSPAKRAIRITTV
jgi:hypothetical protein